MSTPGWRSMPTFLTTITSDIFLIIRFLLVALQAETSNYWLKSVVEGWEKWTRLGNSIELRREERASHPRDARNGLELEERGDVGSCPHPSPTPSISLATLGSAFYLSALFLFALLRPLFSPQPGQHFHCCKGGREIGSNISFVRPGLIVAFAL